MANTFTRSEKWAKYVNVQVERQTPHTRLCGMEQSGYPIEVHHTQAGDGYQVTCNFQPITTTKAPKTAATPTTASSGGSNIKTLTVGVHYFKFDGAVQNVAFEQQKSPHDVVAPEHNRVMREWQETLPQWYFSHLCGDVVLDATAPYEKTAGEAVVAFNNSNVEYAPGTSAHATPAAVGADTTAILTTDMIELMEAKAISGEYQFPIAPAKTPFGYQYVLFTPARGSTQIRSNTSTSRFNDLNLYGMAGGNKDQLQNGLAFIHSRTLVVPVPVGMPANALNTYATTGTSYEADTLVSAFTGACALKVVMGVGYTKDQPLGYASDFRLRDWVFLTDTVQGVQRVRVDNKEWATVLCVHNQAL